VARVDLDTILGRPEILVQEIKNFVSNDPKSIQFRADLAGLRNCSTPLSTENASSINGIAFPMDKAAGVT